MGTLPCRHLASGAGKDAPYPMTITGPGSVLADAAFDPLPLGQIRPAGWLLAQFRTQADGLSGPVDTF